MTHSPTFPVTGMTGCSCGRMFTSYIGWKRHAKAAEKKEAAPSIEEKLSATSKEHTMSDTVWITEFISHRDCESCANAVERARTTARVTGSTGAVFEYREADGLDHTARVKRADAL